MGKKIKKVTLQSKKPFSQKHQFKLITNKDRTIVKSNQGIVRIILLIPLIASAIWLINLLVAYFTPAPPGVYQAPFPHSKLFASTAFMIGYSIFYILFYYTKRKK